MNIVKELRKKKGIQQKELAIIIGVAQPTVSEWEAGKKDPSGDRLKRLAEYFDVDELTVLGKGIIDLTAPGEQPHTPEAISLAKGIDKMPQAQREAILQLMTALYPGIFAKGTEPDDT